MFCTEKPKVWHRILPSSQPTAMCPQYAPLLGLGLLVTHGHVSGRMETCGKGLQYFLTKRHIRCSVVAAAGLAPKLEHLLARGSRNGTAYDADPCLDSVHPGLREGTPWSCPSKTQEVHSFGSLGLAVCTGDMSSISLHSPAAPVKAAHNLLCPDVPGSV